MILTDVVGQLLTVSDLVAVATAGIHKVRLPVDVDGKGTIGVVVGRNSSWYKDEVPSSAQWPRIVVGIHADVTRDDQDRPLADDALDRAMACWKLVDSVMNRPTREMVKWGDSYILGSERETEPSPVPRPGGTVMQITSTYDMKFIEDTSS